MQLLHFFGCREIIFSTEKYTTSEAALDAQANFIGAPEVRGQDVSSEHELYIQLLNHEVAQS